MILRSLLIVATPYDFESNNCGDWSDDWSDESGVCVCVCVCERERERERTRGGGARRVRVGEYILSSFNAIRAMTETGDEGGV